MKERKKKYQSRKTQQLQTASSNQSLPIRQSHIRYRTPKSDRVPSPSTIPLFSNAKDNITIRVAFTNKQLNNTYRAQSHAAQKRGSAESNPIGLSPLCPRNNRQNYCRSKYCRSFFMSTYADRPEEATSLLASTKLLDLSRLAGEKRDEKEEFFSFARPLFVSFALSRGRGAS